MELIYSAVAPQNNIHKVHLGSTHYLPFGDYRTTPTTDTADHSSKTTFTEHKHNDDVGLIYMNARYYVANTNRWLSPDPTNPQSFNRYSWEDMELWT